MTTVTLSTGGTLHEADLDFCDYLLAELRCATLRARILQADFEAVGIALKGGLITPDQALALLCDADLLRLVGKSTEVLP